MVQPILKIGKHLFHIRSTGDYSARLSSTRQDEVGSLSDECDLLIQHIENQQNTLEKQSDELHRLSIEDGLTGLANRRRFDQVLTDFWAICEREKHPLSLIMCDIDFFKHYNDNYGHQQGDKAIKTVANVFQRAINRKTDLAARYGGEEFTLLLPNTDQAGAETLAQHIHELIKIEAITHEFSTASSQLTVCIGIATTRENEEPHSKETLLLHADKALYIAKAAGRNQSAIYRETAAENTKNHTTIN